MPQVSTFATVKIELDKYCVVDAGNTQIKVIDFSGDEIIQQVAIPYHQTDTINEVLNLRVAHTSILSSVVSEEKKQQLIALLQPTIVLDEHTPLPISIEDYKTPHTLGTDRIANAVAANYFSKSENALVIDVGTCIKFDMVVKGRYQGGSISPGYGMRLRAMHEFTGALPLVELEKVDYLEGKSTKESMLSGVLNGVQAEISKFVAFYKAKYPTLTIFLTGGDHKIFEIELKNSIFADNNLTVKGLYLILKHNV